MPASDAVKLERERRKTVREARLTQILADPQVLGLATLLGGLLLAQRLPYSDNPERNDQLRGLATSGVVLAALGRSGIGGWPAVAAAGVSGAVGGGMLDSQPDVSWGAGPLVAKKLADAGLFGGAGLNLLQRWL
jgi:hypothetical protein